MAPLPSTTHRMVSFSKRDYETTTWRIILGCLGVFLLLGLVGILAGWWRQRSAKKQQKLQIMSQRGSYAKLEDDQVSLDDLRSLNDIQVLRLQRTNTISSSLSSDSSKLMEREDQQRLQHDHRLQAKSYQSRSRSLSPMPVSTTKNRISSPDMTGRGRGYSVQPSTEAFMPLHTISEAAPQILVPPRAVRVENGLMAYDTHDDTRV